MIRYSDISRGSKVRVQSGGESRNDIKLQCQFGEELSVRVDNLSFMPAQLNFKVYRLV